MAKIILSVPHAYCRAESDKILHYCDVVAADVARDLEPLLQSLGHEVYLHMGNINRIETDLNRPESRDTEFRKNLEKDFPRADFLLDVHSTPRTRMTWNEDIVILKWLTEEADNRPLTYALANNLIVQDLDVSIAYAQAHDDIVAHALSEGVPAILVEFSELSFAYDSKDLLNKFVVGFNNFLGSEQLAPFTENRVLNSLKRLSKKI